MADVHGLPAGRYDINGLKAQMAAARTTRDMGLVEVALSREFARFARDLQTGLLTPSQIDDGMVRVVERRGAEMSTRVVGDTQG